MGAFIDIARSTMASISGTLHRFIDLQFADTNHRPIADAAIELPQTEIKKSGAQINRPVGSLGKAPHRTHHSIVFLAQLVLSRMQVRRVALGKDQPIDP